MAAYERYFTLADHVGLRDDNGAIEPFVGSQRDRPRPAMVGNQIVDTEGVGSIRSRRARGRRHRPVRR